MIFDKQSLLSDAQAITASAASTNTIDLAVRGTVYGAAAALSGDVGKGHKVPLLIQVVESFATLTSLTVEVQVDDNSAFSSPKTVASTGAVPLAGLTAGKQFSIDTIPLGTDERFLRVNYTVTGTAATAGKITTGVTLGNQTNG